MVLTAAASLWHWMQRPDCTDQNLSVGHWLLSRTLALAGVGQGALRNAKRCLALAAESSKFYIGYGHEAVARAAAVLNDQAKCQAHLLEAHSCLAEITDDTEREMLEKDLQELAHSLGLDV
ncbi:hypothetical protein [Aeoliella sp.]|uniref:hypothetical protein n=1 Tax=Aeoliella sp. TaxID=2795800 RepID=UPI003CCBFA24